MADPRANIPATTQGGMERLCASLGATMLRSTINNEPLSIVNVHFLLASPRASYLKIIHFSDFGRITKANLPSVIRASVVFMTPKGCRKGGRDETISSDSSLSSLL